MSGLGSSDLLLWAAWVAQALALLVPLLVVAYGLAKRPREGRMVGIGLTLTVVAALAWYLGARREAQEEREVQQLKSQIQKAQAASAPRRLDPATRKRLLERLHKIHGPSVFIVANASDEETSQFAREMGGVFKGAGWEVPTSFGMMFSPIILPGEDTVPTGVVLGASPEVPRNITGAVFSALKDSGVDIRLGPHWPGTEHPISLLVGPKR